MMETEKKMLTEEELKQVTGGAVRITPDVKDDCAGIRISERMSAEMPKPNI